MHIGDMYIYEVPFVDKPQMTKPRPVLIIGHPNVHGDALALAGTSQYDGWRREQCLEFSPKDMHDCLLK